MTEKVLEVKTDKKSPVSLISMNPRSIFEDNYPAKWDEALVREKIRQYTSEGETIIDPLCGSGVAPIVAGEENRNAIGIDINPEAIRIASRKWGESCQRYLKRGNVDFVCSEASLALSRLKENYVDFEITSPSFGISIDAAHESYSDIEESMDNASSYQQWRARLLPVLREMFRVLKPGRLAAIETRDRSSKNNHYPLWFWIAEDCFKLGFEYFPAFIEAPTPTYMMYSAGKKESRAPIPWHTYLLMFRKPENGRLL